MLRTLRLGKGFIVLIIFIPFMTLVSYFIYLEYVKTKETLFHIIKEHLIEEKLELFENYSDFIIMKTKGDLKSALDGNNSLCVKYEDQLRLIQGEEIKYLYVLYKDETEKFRFLLDTTLDLEEKAEYDQKFDPQTDIWLKAYQQQKVQVTHQRELDTLWISIAYPVINDGKVLGVIGADFAPATYSRMSNTLVPMEDVYYYATVFMVSLLILAYILIFMYYSTRKKSFIDPLTKVYNRQFLTVLLENISLDDYQIMMIDLDNFKNVNDSYGHDVGDSVLVKVAREIKRNVRDDDVVIRFGGEEFLVLIKEKELIDATNVAERIRISVMKKKIKYNNRYKLQVTLSIGLNPYPFQSKNIEDAIKIADEQLYIAKTSGRNQVKVFNNEKVKRRGNKRISDIQLAIDKDRIKCVYQPIFSTSNNEIVKYETLIRMFDEDGDVVAPNEFLPAIRHTQVYINLTRIVLDNAMDMLSKSKYDLSINLDIQDLLNDDIYTLFTQRFVDKTELANRLCIEILEHEEIRNFDVIGERIEYLRDLGLCIGLDDFGSGYANYSYLINLNLNVLKIDGSLIRDIDFNKKSYSIVESIVSFSKNMDIKTVAEQIETKAEFETIKALGVDYAQGYYLGRPSFEVK